MNIEQLIDELAVVSIPHPALRHKSKPLTRVDRHIKNIVARMFELMYENKGVGLAANQVSLPFQLFVVNTEGKPDSGKERTFLNPVIESPKGRSEMEEGCLSIPTVFGEVIRPD